MFNVRVNIRTSVANKDIRRERRNGRDIIVVPSATLPDNIVMNGIMYPADEIEKSYRSLDRTPAPLGHPDIDGTFVSAMDPEGVVRGFIGAWNENVRRENGRVLLDKIIDVEYAKQLEGGKTVLNAIEAGDPIHTSTGLYGILVKAENGKNYQKIMTEMQFDHDAILLGQEGAATPEQGVGMLVNKAVEPSEGGSVEVINSALERAEDELDWAGTYLLDALQRVEKASKWEQMKSRLLSLLSGNSVTEEGEMAMDKGQYDELSGKLDKLSETIDGIGDAIANALKPVTDSLTEMQNAAKAEKNAEKAVLVNKVVEAGVVSEEIAKALDVAALKDIAANLKTPGGKAAPLNGTFQNDNGNVKSFKLPGAEKKEA